LLGAAGVLGVVLVRATAPVLSGLLPFPLVFRPWNLALPPLGAALLALLGAWWPAQAAARMDPAAALRNE
jgi:ABC-type antimicrobial peptide transport system permease subunit